VGDIPEPMGGREREMRSGTAGHWTRQCEATAGQLISHLYGQGKGSGTCMRIGIAATVCYGVLLCDGANSISPSIKHADRGMWLAGPDVKDLAVWGVVGQMKCFTRPA